MPLQDKIQKIPYDRREAYIEGWMEGLEIIRKREREERRKKREREAGREREKLNSIVTEPAAHKKCLCGCGRDIVQKGNRPKKYYETSCRVRHNRQKRK